MKVQFFNFFLFFAIFHLHGQEQKSVLISESLECNESYELVDFQLATNDRGAAPVYPYKVVIGRKIDYKTRPIRDGIRFLWELGDYDTVGVFHPFKRYALRAIGSDSLLGTGQAIIPKDSILRKPTYFGSDSSGVIFVEKYTTVDTQTVYSTTHLESNALNIFFDKDTMNIHNNSKPNWIYYWEQISEIDDLLSIPGIRLYNTETCSFNENSTPLRVNIFYWPAYTYSVSGNVTYGSSSLEFEAAQGLAVLCSEDTAYVQAPAIEYDSYFSNIKIGDGCGFHKQLDTNLIDRNNPLIDMRGIHVFYSTMIHEREHLLIKCEVWAAGYNRKKDRDDDGYNDDWEMQIRATGENPFVNFVSAYPRGHALWREDRYGYLPNGIIQNYQSILLFQIPPFYSMGTEYEEYRCRARERELFISGDIMNLDNKDWSFDPSNINQGKQWK